MLVQTGTALRSARREDGERKQAASRAPSACGAARAAAVRVSDAPELQQPQAEEAASWPTASQATGRGQRQVKKSILCSAAAGAMNDHCSREGKRDTRGSEVGAQRRRRCLSGARSAGRKGRAGD
jgi:hypothetical protein